MFEEPQLGWDSGSAAVAGDPAVGSEHTVAGHDDRDRVCSDCTADRAPSSGSTGSQTQFTVRGHFSPLERGQLVPNRMLKLGSTSGERYREGPAAAAEVFVKLACGSVENPIRCFRKRIEGQPSFALDRESGQGLCVAREFETTDGAVDSAQPGRWGVVGHVSTVGPDRDA